MPDKINILKICSIFTAGAISLCIAAKSAESYAAETALKEKTLAEAIIQNQLKEELERAEEELRKELEKQEITIETSVLETKPPVTEPPETEPPATTTTETTPPATETTTVTTTAPPTEKPTETEAKEEIITEFTRGGILPVDRTNIQRRSMLGLSEAEKRQVMSFLIEHYFLDGFVYSENETRPELKEKKYLAAQMESYVVRSFYLITGITTSTDITALASADFAATRKQAEDIRDEFKAQYTDAGQHGEQYAKLYDDSLKYFDRLVEALQKVENVADQYKNAANPLLAFGLLTSAVNDVILPEIMAVLEQSFDFVELTQEIYLEGTQGTKLLSRDEVRDIIENPGLALYVINNG